MTWGTTMGRVNRAGAALLMSIVVGAVGVPAPATAAPAPVDPAGADLVSLALDRAGGLTLGLRTAEGTLHRPEAVVVTEDAGVAGAVPEHPAYDFLGEPGEAVWALAPAGGDFPAWDTTGVPADRLAGDTVTLRLVDVDGPGDFHAYAMNPVGEPRLLLGTSAEAPRRTELAAGVRHGGTIWAFDAPGTHRVTVAAETTLASGSTATDQAVYQVDVPELPAVAPPLPGTRAAGAPLAQPEQPLARQPAAPRDDETGEGRVVIDDGHVDFGPRFVDGTWTVQLKDDTVSPIVWRNLADVVLKANDNAMMRVPEGDFGFLGEPGDEVWLLPQAQQAGIVWPGWNTEHSSVVGEISGNVTFSLREVTGPGEFVLFLTGSFGAADILLNTRESLPQEMSVPLRTHAHGNWAFTEPGVYHLTFQVSGATTGGDAVSDTRILAFAVGDDTDPDTAFPPGGGGDGNGSGDGNGDGDGDGAGSGGPGALGKTGVNLAILLVAGGVLLTGGGLLVLVTRRRRARVAPEPA